MEYYTFLSVLNLYKCYQQPNFFVLFFFFFSEKVMSAIYCLYYPMIALNVFFNLIVYKMINY